MTRNSCRAAGAAIAGILAAVPPIAVADPAVGSAGSTPGSTSGGQVTTAPLPPSVVQCLVQAGYQITAPATVTVPPIGHTADITSSTPVTGTGTTPATGTGTTATTPAPGTGTTATTLPGGTGTTALPVTHVSSSAGLECGQIIVNNTVYLVVVTTTTTTTTANGPQTAANGPVTITSGSPTTTTGGTTNTTKPVTTKPPGSGKNPTPGAGKKSTPRAPKKSTPRPTRHKHTTARKRPARRQARGPHKRVVRVVLVRERED